MTKRIQSPNGEHQKVFKQRLDRNLQRNRRSNDLEKVMLQTYLNNPSRNKAIAPHSDWIYALVFFVFWLTAWTLLYLTME